jgi:hypothetical protein
MRNADYRHKAPTLIARLHCYAIGHDVREWGSMLGWCHRCRHSIHNCGRRRRVIYCGEYHSFPPRANPQIDWSAKRPRPGRARSSVGDLVAARHG